MHVLKSVGVLSVARMMGVLYGCLGLIFIPFFLIFAMVGTFAGQKTAPFAGVIGVMFAIALPVLYGFMGFITGAIGAALYNLLAKWFGGFELELEIGPTGLTAPYPLVPPATPVAN